MRQLEGRHLLFLSFPKRLHSNRDQIWTREGEKFRNDLVSAWQEILGDRVISTGRQQDFLVLWEFGQLKTVIEQLLKSFQSMAVDPPEHVGELRIGVATVSEDFQGSVDLANSRCESAFLQSVNYLPECLVD